MTSSSLHRCMRAFPSIPVAPKISTCMFQLCRTYELREDIAPSASTAVSNSLSDIGQPNVEGHAQPYPPELRNATNFGWPMHNDRTRYVTVQFKHNCSITVGLYSV